MSDTGGNALSKNYGPLPGSVWLLLVFCAGFLFIKMHQGKGNRAGSGGGNNGTIGSYNGQGNSPKFSTSSNVTQTFNDRGQIVTTNQGAGAGATTVTTTTTDDHSHGPAFPAPCPPPRGQHWHHERADCGGRGGYGRDCW